MWNFRCFNNNPTDQQLPGNDVWFWHVCVFPVAYDGHWHSFFLCCFFFLCVLFFNIEWNLWVLACDFTCEVFSRLFFFFYCAHFDLFTTIRVESYSVETSSAHLFVGFETRVAHLDPSNVEFRLSLSLLVSLLV